MILPFTAMRVSSDGTDHLLCLSDEEVELLVDLCHASDFSDHIELSADRSGRMEVFLGQVQQ